MQTGAAKLLATQSFPQQQDTYSGWFKRCINATTLVRMGFQDVVNERTFGVAITVLQQGGTVSTTFQPVLAPAGYADQFATVDVLNATTLLSLCPFSSTDGEYSVCSYGPTSNSARVVAKLGNSVSSDGRSCGHACTLTMPAARDGLFRSRVVGHQSGEDAVWRHHVGA